jgi:hypothetical protein
LQSRGTSIVDGAAQRRGENLKGIEANKLLSRTLGIGSPNMGHRLKRSAKPAPGTHGVTGHSLEATLFTREEADEEVRLLKGPCT